MKHYRVTKRPVGLQKHPWLYNHSLDMDAERELVFRKDGNNGKSSVCEWNYSRMFQKGFPDKTDSVCIQNHFGERLWVVVRVCCRIPELNLGMDWAVQTIITGSNSAQNCLVMAASDLSDIGWRRSAAEGSLDIPWCDNWQLFWEKAEKILSKLSYGNHRGCYRTSNCSKIALNPINVGLIYIQWRDKQK